MGGFWRRRGGVLSLCLGGIALGSAEFLPMGLLPDIAGSLRVSIPQAGHLLSAYAAGVVLGAPLLVAMGLRFAPQRVLVVFMSAFALFNAAFAAAPGYALLVIARFFAGLPHGAFFGLGAVVAARLAPRGREASSVASMFAGLTVANVLCVPLGTWLGHVVHWRVPFAAVALIALGAVWAMHRAIPAIPASPEGGIRTALRSFCSPGFLPLIGISAIGTGGLYAWISYIAPLVTDVTGLAQSRVSGVMILAGLGMAVGNWAGGWIADRHPPLETVGILLAAVMVAVLLVAALAPYVIPTLVMTFVTGAIAFALIAPLQMVMLDGARGSKTMASAVMQSTSNIGNALGAYLGGLGIAGGWGLTAPDFIGAAMAGVGVLCALTLLRARRRSPAVPASAPAWDAERA